MYMSSVIGAGVLVLPGLTARIAGPGSLLAWVLLSFASYPFAYTFATLSTRHPESGGIYGFVREAFGSRTANMVGWLFGLWVIAGAPANTLIAASYLAFALPLSKLELFLVAGAIIFGGFVTNYRGIVVSGRVQVAVVVSILALLLAALVASAGSIRAENFVPFFPNGLFPVGVAAALIVWSFLGYENVSNIAEEFENPERDFHRSIVLSVVAISALYIAVALATVGTNAYARGGSVAPFAAMLSNVLGNYAAIGTAIVALLIIFGTVNVYTAGISRVLYAVALGGGLPKSLATVNPSNGVPTRALMLLSGLALCGIFVYYFLSVDLQTTLQTALLIPSGAAILVYVLGSAAGIKLLKMKGLKRLLPWFSFIISLAILPFVGVLLSASFAVMGLSLLYMQLSKRHS
jgi:amino acid efflux transporter